MKYATKENIKKLERELAETADAKRRTFLMATINRYRKALCLDRKYQF